jgi:molybdopterin molybdotransferase
MSDWLSVADAQEAILAHVAVGLSIAVPLDDGLGRSLAEDIEAGVDVPSFDNSAMDGYAVRWGDALQGCRLPVAFAVAAGSDPAPLPEGSVARIFTGGRLPEGADTVIVQEDTSVGSEGVRFVELPRVGRGANVRFCGCYVRAGRRILEEGTVLGPGEINLLATLNRAQVAVRVRPRVAVLSTGDELVDVGSPLGPGQIVNSTSHMLAGLIAGAGGVPVVYPIVRDRMDDTLRAFREAVDDCDLVVSMGGVSVGDHDLVKPAMERLCKQLDFWKVQMKPGKPLAFGVTPEGTPLIGLPGNPVSSWTGFWQFVRPSIRRSLGLRRLLLSRRWVTLGESLSSTARRLDMQRGRLVNAGRTAKFFPFASQSSSDPMSIVAAEVLGRVPVGVSSLSAGDEIEVDVLEP